LGSVACSESSAEMPNLFVARKPVDVSFVLIGRLKGFVATGLLAFVLLFACGAASTGSSSLGPLAQFTRFLVPLLASGLVLVLVVHDPARGLSVFIATLPFIGLVRREMIPLIGYSGTDPITLVPSIIALVLVAQLLLARRVKVDSTASKLLLPLFIVMGFQIFNPAQGGVVVGIAGAVFYIVPILFFYVGKNYGSLVTLDRVFDVVLWAGIVCAFYGLYQNAIGFNDREFAWIEAARYRQSAAGFFRVFSTFLSFGEYVLFLGIALAVAWTRLLRRQWIYIPAVVLLAFSVFVSSSRGAVFMNLFSMSLAWAVLGWNNRRWLARFAILGGLFTVLTINSVDRVELDSMDARNSVLLEHQISGLRDPLGEESTGQFHLSLLGIGLKSAFLNPAGKGLGSTTIASAKFGTSAGVSTEIDVTNFMVSTGTIGGFLYLSLVVVLVKRLFEHWHRTRSNFALTAIAVGAVGLGNWTTGGYYAPSVLMWLMLGGIDGILVRFESERQRADSVDRKPKSVSPAVPVLLG